MDLLLGAGGIGVLVIIILIALFVILRSYKIASPSEALIITGRGATGSSGTGRIVIGGRSVVYPIVQPYFSNLAALGPPDRIRAVVFSSDSFWFGGCRCICLRS